MKSDHKILEYIFTQKDLNACQRRWSELLTEYDFKISYIKGKENKVANSLSRKPHINVISSIQINPYDKIREQLCNDQWYIQIRSALEKGKSTSTKTDGYSLDQGGLLRLQGRVYVPTNDELTRLVLDEAHRAHYSAHPGVCKILETIRKALFWVGMKKEIVHYIAHCLECQQVKVEHWHQLDFFNLMTYPNLNGRPSPWTLRWDYLSHRRYMTA